MGDNIEQGVGGDEGENSALVGIGHARVKLEGLVSNGSELNAMS